MNTAVARRVFALLAFVSFGAVLARCGNGEPPPLESGDDGSSGGDDPAGDDDGGHAIVLFEAGTNLGACGSDQSCPAGASCFFKIGSCAATGQCIADGTGPECKAIRVLCGCTDASTVATGCGYPSGYASGPTTGSDTCGLAPPVGDAGDAATRDASPDASQPAHDASPASHDAAVDAPRDARRGAG
jgi:hypothetical protein